MNLKCKCTYALSKFFTFKKLFLFTFLLFSLSVFGREESVNNKTVTVRGKVIDASNNEPLIGVNVLLKGTSEGTITDIDGNYSYTVSSSDVLQFSFIGYKVVEIPVGEQQDISIAMDVDAVGMDEVVVVGYGSMKKSDLTGAVSSVDRQEIMEQASYSMDNVLQGQTAGLHVKQGSFRPGESADILIRGQRSLGGSNAPLVVVDGVPIESGLMDINPSDVESVEVLKDASSAAIYGSRAANGVILVTTRRGSEGKTTVEYNGFASIQKTYRRMDLMDTQTYAEFFRDAYRLDGSYESDEKLFAPWQLDAIAENRSTDWQDFVFDNGFQQNHNISIRGGDKKTSYSISLTMDEHQATVANNDFKRSAARFSLDHEVSSFLRVGLSGYLSDSEQHQGVAFTNVLRNTPMASPYDENGNVPMLDEMGNRNPIYDMDPNNNLDERLSTRVYGTFFAEANLLPGLKFRTSFTPDYSFNTRGTYKRDNVSSASKSGNNISNTLFESLLTYEKDFKEKHRTHFTYMYGQQRNETDSYHMSVRGLPYEHQKYHDLGSADVIDSWGSALSQWGLESHMFRANYVYDDRYLFTLTSRIDGSSRLADEHKYSLFPSMAVAWHVANEEFMSNVNFVSSLKLRFSIGETGNTGIDPYKTLGMLAQGDVYAFGGTEYRYFQHGDIPNPDLKWERTRSKDLGVDFGFFKNRLTGAVDVYDNETFDLLMLRNLPASSGYTSVLENVGETRNRGVEVTLSSVNVRTKDFTWNTDFNFSANKNEIVSLYGGKDDDIGNLWFIGQPINVNYYWQFDGIWQEHEAEQAAIYGQTPGEVRRKDINGDGKIDDQDMSILGSEDPRWIAGITNRFNYKNIDFSFFIYGEQGTQHRSTYGASGYRDLLSLQAHAEQNNMRNVQYWTPDNASNEFAKPAVGSSDGNYTQAYFNTSFIRVKNITLGYTLPSTVLSKLKMSRARIYTTVQNPFTITKFGGYDPEAARDFDMPGYTSFILGLNLSF